MNPNDERAALLLARQHGDRSLAARAEAAIRARYPDALRSTEQQAADDAEAALVAADEWLYRVRDALRGALLGGDPDLLARLEASEAEARAASDAAARAHDAAQAALAAARRPAAPRGRP